MLDPRGPDGGSAGDAFLRLGATIIASRGDPGCLEGWGWFRGVSVCFMATRGGVVELRVFVDISTTSSTRVAGLFATLNNFSVVAKPLFLVGGLRVVTVVASTRVYRGGGVRPAMVLLGAPFPVTGVVGTKPTFVRWFVVAKTFLLSFVDFTPEKWPPVGSDGGGIGSWWFGLGDFYMEISGNFGVYVTKLSLVGDARGMGKWVRKVVAFPRDVVPTGATLITVSNFGAVGDTGGTADVATIVFGTFFVASPVGCFVGGFVTLLRE